MSSHREAPEISKDPVADSSDLYAFVSPDKPDTVTIIANYVPLQQPAGGPNFYEFGDDVLYQIFIDNDGDGDADITYQFQFYTLLTDQGPNDIFLYNTGQINHLTDTTWNRKQFYRVTRCDRKEGWGGAQWDSNVIAEWLAVPAVQRRRQLDPQLRRPDQQAIQTVGLEQVLRRAARRRLLRRPRVDLRPRRAAPLRS